jgi:hypothetical protein
MMLGIAAAEHLVMSLSIRQQIDSQHRILSQLD